jgi:hypothetical protein
MGTVDRNCGATLPAGAARPWHALTASLSVVVCCFVWLCVRQCHELILKTRAEQSQSAGARAFAWVAAAANQARHAILTVTGHEIRATLNPALGLTTLLVIPLLDAQPRLPVDSIFDPGDNLLYTLNDTLDFSGLETARLELAQHGFSPASAFAPESLVDQTVSMADVWTDHATGSWMADFSNYDSADTLWHDAEVMPVLASIDAFNVPSADNVGFNPGPAWQAHGAFDFHSDDAPASWLMDGFDLVSNNDASVIAAAVWQDIQPYYDLI